ncbi:hypothetical protein BH23ACT10_BH23ACT10_29240 [soil metagenome]
MIEATVLAGIVIAGVIAVIVSVEAITRREFAVPMHETLDVRGPPPFLDDVGPDVIEFIDELADQPQQVSFFEVYERGRLINVDQMRGMDAIEDLLHDLAEQVVDARRRPRRRPRRPTSILLHGPPGSAMTILAHVFARRFRARLVQVFASQIVATNNGGSQPLVAIAVGQARDRLPSVLVLDELDVLAGADVRDADKRRAANDLIGESLRAVYGPSHLVLAVYTTYGSDRPSPALIQRFEHVVRVDVPELERAMLITAINTADDALFRSVPTTRLAERADVHRHLGNAA